MEVILVLFKELWTVWIEMFKLIRTFLMKFLIFIVWAFCGIFVLICVYVAGNLYPEWTKWGEKL